MDKNPVSLFWTAILAIALPVGLGAADGFSFVAYGADTSLADFPAFNEEVVKQRLDKLENEVVPPQYNSVVRSYIQTYTERRRDVSARIIGRSLMYFPMIEHYLEEYDLPNDLKYLAIVESALVPHANSRVGAVGLWQFMPPTAKWMGLDITREIDERVDPHKSTQAAMRYLTHLYDRFGDWELAIAAYNGGSGRVSRAIKRARSKNFWKIRRFLPRETRNYVPAFIGAYYLMHHYGDHDIEPDYPELDLQVTKTIKVYSEHSFYEIAQVTGIPLSIIETLNPGYTKRRVPANQNGNFLTLPSRVMLAFQQYLDSLRPDNRLPVPVLSAPVFVSRPSNLLDAEYEAMTYEMQEGETLEDIALRLNCTTHQLRVWNYPDVKEFGPGKKLTVYVPGRIKHFAENKLEAIAHVIEPLGIRTPQPLSVWVRERQSFVTKGGYLYYEIPRSMRVYELAGHIPDLEIRSLMRLNGFTGPLHEVDKGDFVRIRPM